MQTHLRAAAVLVAGLLLLVLPFQRDLSRAVGPLLQPLRMAQKWQLYGTGPLVLRRFEVHVDGAPVYRAGDAAHRWRRNTLTYRRVRPTVVHTCMGNGRNAKHLMNWVVTAVREDFPSAREVQIRCTTTPFPTGDEHVELSAHADAPEWLVRTQ